MKRCIRSLISVLLVLSLAVGSLCFSFGADAAETVMVNLSVTGTVHRAEARRMLPMINSLRMNSKTWYWDTDNKTKLYVKNLDKLAYDYQLEEYAIQRAMELAASFSHTRPDGSNWSTIYDESYTSRAENLAWGFNDTNTSELAFDTWCETNCNYSGQGHRRNMLRSNCTCVGVACVQIGRYWFWAQEFGDPNSNKAKTSAADQTVTKKIRADMPVTDLSMEADIDEVMVDGGRETPLPSVTVKANIVHAGGYSALKSSYNVTDASISYEVQDTTVAKVVGKKLKGLQDGFTVLTVTAKVGAVKLSRKFSVTVNGGKLTSDLYMMLLDDNFVYNGKQHKPAVLVMDGNEELVEGTHYTLSYKDYINAGTASVIVTGKGSYTESATLRYSIFQKPIDNADVRISRNAAGTLQAAVYLDGARLNENTDYSVAFKNVVDAQRGTLTSHCTVTGIGNYIGTAEKDYTFDSVSVQYLDISLSQTKYTYDGTAKKPTVTVKNGGSVLKNGKDYTVSYKNNTVAGKATATVVGAGYYEGTAAKSFVINRQNVNKATIKLSATSFTYTGKALKPGISVKIGSRTLKNGKDYKLTYTGNVNAGKASVAISGMNNYNGSVKKTYTIRPISINKYKLTIPKTSYVYTGKAIKPAATLKNGSKVIAKGNYTVAYKANTETGKATVTLTAKGNYTGKLSTTFLIIPKAASFKSCTSPSRTTIKMQWTMDMQASGYETEFSMYKDFKKRSGAVYNKYTAKRFNITGFSCTGLRSGNVYYARVRAYKIIGGKQVFGAYSKVKTVKIK